MANTYTTKMDALKNAADWSTKPIRDQLRKGAMIVGGALALGAIQWVGSHADPFLRSTVGKLASEQTTGVGLMVLGYNASRIGDILRGKYIKAPILNAINLYASINLAPTLEAAFRMPSPPLTSIPNSDWQVTTSYFLTGAALGWGLGMLWPRKD